MIQKVSSGRIKCYKECKKKFFFKYIENLAPFASAAMKFGSFFHKGIELMLTGLDVMSRQEMEDAILEETDQDDVARMTPEDDMELSKAIIALESWKQRDPLGLFSNIKGGVPVLAVEEFFELSTGYGKRIRGFIDMLVQVEGKLWIVEHKTTSMLNADYLQNLLKDEQASMYVLAAKRLHGSVQGILYDIAEKPRIRVKKNESDSEFLKRFEEWYAEENRFTVQRVYRTEEQLQIFAKELDDVMEDMRRSERNGSFYRSPSVCNSSYFTCPFAGICLEDTPEAREGLYTERKEIQ